MNHLLRITLPCVAWMYVGLNVSASISTTATTTASHSVQLDTLYGKEQKLSEVQVTGKTKARLLQEQAYAISVVNLQRYYTQNPTLQKVLNTVTGVRVREDGGLGSQYTFSMNGFSGNQVKFFLDGIPMDRFGTSFNLSNISSNMAERVEVYKGVLPVYLGSDALGGAVNVVTRQKANYLDATYSVGSFNTHRVGLNGAYTHAPTGFTVRANTFFNYSKNNYQVFAPIVDLSTNKVVENRWVKRFHDSYNSYGLRLETGWVGKSWADYLLLGLIVSANDKDIQTGATMDAVYGGAEVKSHSIIPSLRWKKNNVFVDGLSLSFYGAYNIQNIHNIDTLSRQYNWLGQYVPATSAGEGYLTDAKIKQKEWLANANANYIIDQHQSLTLNHVLTSMQRKADERRNPNPLTNNVPQYITKNVTGLGYQLRYDKWNINVFGKMYFLNTSTYQLFDAFKTTERWEKVKAHKEHLGYGAAATYFILPSLQAKVSFEQAYRMPEAIEIFGDGFIQKSNLNLLPENSKNLNIGLALNQRWDSHRILAEANFVYRYTKDFIFKGVTLSADPTTGYENLGKVITKGIEGSIRYEYKNIFFIGGNMTFQDIKDRMKTQTNSNSYIGTGITDNITYGQRLPNIPYFFMNGETGVNFHDLGSKGNTLSLVYFNDYVYRYYLSFPGLGAKASKKIIPEQFAHNASISYSMGQGRYSIALEAINITDKILFDNYRLQKPGRAFHLKFRYFINR